MRSRVPIALRRCDRGRRFDRSSDYCLHVKQLARMVRGLRHCATFSQHANFHEDLLRHRQPDCTAALRPRRGRVRPAARRTRTQGLHPPRLTFARGDRSPRSPEATRTPSGSPPGGVLFSGVRKGTPKVYRDCIALPKHPDCAGPRQGKPRKRIDALCLGASARAAGGCGRARIGAFDEAPVRNIVRTVHSGTGSHARPVRAALPWRMPRIGRRCFAKRR